MKPKSLWKLQLSILFFFGPHYRIKYQMKRKSEYVAETSPRVHCNGQASIKSHLKIPRLELLLIDALCLQMSLPLKPYFWKSKWINGWILCSACLLSKF